MQTFILPLFCEFGFYILSYTREVHTLKCDKKIVSCSKGEECLFPSATDFFYDWKDIDDSIKRGVVKNEDRWNDIIEIAKCKYGNDIAIHRPSGDVRSKLHITFDITGTTKVPKSDICICARKRLVAPSRNFKYWQAVIDFCKTFGLTVSVVGKQEFTFSDLHNVDFFSFDFGNTTDSVVSVLKNSKILLTTDTGISHLASLIRMRQMVIESPMASAIGWIKRDRPDLVIHLPKTCYKDPQPIFVQIESLCNESYFS